MPYWVTSIHQIYPHWDLHYERHQANGKGGLWCNIVGRIWHKCRCCLGRTVPVWNGVLLLTARLILGFTNHRLLFRYFVFSFIPNTAGLCREGCYVHTHIHTSQISNNILCSSNACEITTTRRKNDLKKKQPLRMSAVRSGTCSSLQG